MQSRNEPNVVVECLTCGHTNVLTREALSRFSIGANTPIAAFIKRLRCRRCGSQSVLAARKPRLRKRHNRNQRHAAATHFLLRARARPVNLLGFPGNVILGTSHVNPGLRHAAPKLVVVVCCRFSGPLRTLAGVFPGMPESSQWPVTVPLPEFTSAIRNFGKRFLFPSSAYPGTPESSQWSGRGKLRLKRRFRASVNKFPYYQA
jgi:hypothetical protein